MYQLQSSTSVSFEQSVLEDLEQMCTFVANVVALQPIDIEYVGHCRSQREPEVIRHNEPVPKALTWTIYAKGCRIVCSAKPLGLPVDIS